MLPGRLPLFGSAQTIVKVLCGRGICLPQPLAPPVSLPRFGARRHQGHSGAVGQRAERLAEINVLHPLDESEGVTPRGTRAKTVPPPPVGKDHERGSFLLVEGAEGFVIPPRLLQRQIGGHEVDNVDPLFHIIYDRHNAPSPAKATGTPSPLSTIGAPSPGIRPPGKKEGRCPEDGDRPWGSSGGPAPATWRDPRPGSLGSRSLSPGPGTAGSPRSSGPHPWRGGSPPDRRPPPA